MRLFQAVLLAGVAQANDFLVTSCNNDNTNSTEMTISVTHAYMNEHHDNLKADFTLDANNNYIKVIPGPALTLDLTDSTYIYLVHELVTTEEVVADSSIMFAGQKTTFKCQYPRSVSVGSSYDVTEFDPNPFVGNGELRYGIDSVATGGRTTITISPQHGLTSLHANVQKCEVTYSGNTGASIFPLHSFDDSGTCIDNRFGTTFGVDTNGVITLDYRSFHFNSGSDSQQEHQITCDANVSDTLSVINPSNCDCYSEADCTGPTSIQSAPDENNIARNNLLLEDFSLPFLYEFSFDLKLTTPSNTGWRNVFHGTRGRDRGRCGDRLPTLWLVAGTQTAMQFASCVGNNVDYKWPRNQDGWDEAFVATIDQWYHIQIGNRDDGNGVYTFYIKIDGNDIHTAPQGSSPLHSAPIDNMNMYTSDTWYRQADGSIRNVLLTSPTI